MTSGGKDASGGPSGGSGVQAAVSSSLLNQPIVMDVGTDTTKAGFAGGAKPKVRELVCRAVLCCDVMSRDVL